MKWLKVHDMPLYKKVKQFNWILSFLKFSWEIPRKEGCKLVAPKLYYTLDSFESF